MNQSEKVLYYNKYKETIHPNIKSGECTKPLWRKLFWTTGRDSDEYKSGCVDIFQEYFNELFHDLKDN